jgi:acyl carrier protein
MTTTHERLAELISRDFQVPRESLGADATLEGLDIDSLRMIEILFAIEDEFAISMPQDQGEIRGRVKTLGDLAALVDEVAAAKAAG